MPINSNKEKLISIQFYERESEVAKENHLIGTFKVDKMGDPRDRPDIEVTFDIDTTGILKVFTGAEKSNGDRENILINDIKNVSQKKKSMNDAQCGHHVDCKKAKLN